MAQPSIVGESGKVNGRQASSASPRTETQSASMKTRREPTPSSRRSSKTPPAHAEASTKTTKTARAARRGATMPRRYTEVGSDPFDSVVWERRSSVINNTDGSVVFKMQGAEIPAGWSQLATDIVVSKYFRK